MLINKTNVTANLLKDEMFMPRSYKSQTRNLGQVCHDTSIHLYFKVHYLLQYIVAEEIIITRMGLVIRAT